MCHAIGVGERLRLDQYVEPGIIEAGGCGSGCLDDVQLFEHDHALARDARLKDGIAALGRCDWRDYPGGVIREIAERHR